MPHYAHGLWAIAIASDGITDHMHRTLGFESATRRNAQGVHTP